MTRYRALTERVLELVVEVFWIAGFLVLLGVAVGAFFGAVKYGLVALEAFHNLFGSAVGYGDLHGDLLWTALPWYLKWLECGLGIGMVIALLLHLERLR